MHYFITGTDTDAGKTYVTCLLLRALTAQGTRAVGFKPVTCGGREDAIALRDAGTPGLEVGRVTHKMGVRSSDTRDVVLTNVRVSESQLLGSLGGGFTIDTVRTGTWGSRRVRTLSAEQVIVAAGTYNSQRLLHRMKDSGRLPRLSSMLGRLSRTNSESILGAVTRTSPADFTGTMTRCSSSSGSMFTVQTRRGMSR